MVEITRLQCPTCGAGVEVAQGATRAHCEFCQSSLAVRVDHGELVLHSLEQVTGAVREEGQRTQYALARMELWQSRVQVATDLAAATTQLQNLNAELRSLRRMAQDRTVEWQIQEVQAQRARVEEHCDTLQQTIATIDNALNPQDAESVISEQTPTTAHEGEAIPSMSWVVWSKRGSILRTIIVVIVVLFVAFQILTLIYTLLGLMPNGQIADGAPQQIFTVLLITALIGGIIIGWNPSRLYRLSQRLVAQAKHSDTGGSATPTMRSGPIVQED